jgi:Cytochrome P460
MNHRLVLLLAALGIAGAAGAASDGARISRDDGPVYTQDGQLRRPADYREWIYLSSGIDMNYRERPSGMNHSMFDNVFAAPAAYRAFRETGTWPDKTVLVMEVRGASDKGSINKSGHFQTADLMGMEAHVKDTARFPGGWAFFAFDDADTASALPREAPCYSCHSKHGAVDTTFVQFYPTLLGIARQKGTLSAAYLSDEAKMAGSGDAPAH